MSTKFNVTSDSHTTGSKDLFLGKELGVLDTINVVYPQLEELYQDQLAQIWNEFEVDLTQDKLDMVEMNPKTVDLMVQTIMWQTVADSVASRSILETLGKHITNSELMNLATVWTFFEVIHARTYSHIIKQTFTDPNELLSEIYANAEVLQRSDVIVDAFDVLSNLSEDSSDDAIQDAILMAFVALFALEAIAFMASFAVTFSIVETGKFQGIGKLVQLICRDEVLHTRMDYTILDILIKDPKWADCIERNSTSIEELLDTVVANEMTWAKHVFSDGREVMGLNAEMLKDYVLHMAAPVYNVFGCDLVAPKENPLPYMDKYIDPSKMQTANMELQSSSYLVGTLEDDTNDLDLDFL